MCLKRITIATKTGGGREGGRQAEVGGGGESRRGVAEGVVLYLTKLAPQS